MDGEIKANTKKVFKFERECKYCSGKFQPTGGRNFACRSCMKKILITTNMKCNLKRFRRELAILIEDKGKGWYKKLEKFVNEFEVIIKEIQRDMKRK